MPSRPYILAESTYKSVRDTKWEVAVLPWGATEAHNFHLPYGTDVLEAEHAAASAAAVAWEQGARVVVLPTIPFGVNTGQLGIPLCINMNPSTQAAVLADVAESLDAHGVRKLVVLNTHGGNDFRQMLRELQPRVRVFLCTINWWTSVDARPFFDQPGDHAGELETSVIMHIAPQLVLPLSEAGPGKSNPFRLRGLRERVAWAPREWTKATRDTGVGDPAASTAEKGRAFVDAVAARIGEFLVELAAADPEDMYER